MDLLRGLEQHALAVRENLPTTPFMTVEAPAPDVQLAMDRPLFSPPIKPRIEQAPLEEGTADIAADPLFEQAVVYGDGRNFITAVVVPNLDLLESVAENLGCAIDCQDGCVTTTQLLDYIDSKVQQLMQVVSQPERVKKCLVLDKPFQLENDELTATLKVRRRHIIAKYETRLEALYD